MKFYKEEIKNVTPGDVSLEEHYHIWSPESIRRFWTIWANNKRLSQQFYPEEYYENLFNRLPAFINKSASVVDIGCGTGTVLSVLERLKVGQSFVGVDLSEESISELQKKFRGESRFTFKVGSFSHIPLEDNIYDVVTCTEVLEHLFPDDIEKGLKEVARVLRKGGFFIATVPIGEKVNFVVCPECQAIFTPFQHMLFEFTEEYLENELEKHGLKLIQFVYPVNTKRPNSLIKHVLKNKIMIPLFPKVARKIFPIAGITGFVAIKKGT